MTALSKPSLLHRHAGAFAACSVVLFVFIWMVTFGTWDIFGKEQFGQFYDAQAASLLAGHWDVPPRSIYPEGFYHNGNAFGYFGFVPALPRMALNRIFPEMHGAWSRFSLVLGCVVTLLSSYSILRRARQWMHLPADLSPSTQLVYGSFLLMAGLGSTTLYLGSCAFVYHEAIIWAIALALACHDQLLAYLMDAKLRRLLLACVLAFLCFFCRISTGCGPLLSLVLLGAAATASSRRRPAVASSQPIDDCHRKLLRLRQDARPRPLLGHLAIIAITLGIVLISYVAINHAKFGTFLNPAPMQLHEQVTSSPGRWERTGGHWMRVGNISTNTWAYVSPASITFTREFPWVDLQSSLHLFPGSRLDGWGPHGSVVTTMPVCVILAMFGIGALRRPRTIVVPGQPRPIASPMLFLIGSLGGVFPTLAMCNVDHRYLHEFFPFLIIASAFGVHRLCRIHPRKSKSLLVAAMIVLGGLQIYANCSFALVYQRLRVFSRPIAPELQMRHWQQNIGRYFKTNS